MRCTKQEDRESVNEILIRILAKQAAISGGLLLCSKILLKFQRALKLHFA